jgi:heme-degrading monooxygenase HmoA
VEPPAASLPSRLPAPPYYAVIFTSKRTEEEAGYEAAAARMFELAKQRRGFLGFESARGSDRLGITVSYWTDLPAIAAWRADLEHRAVQESGRARWYECYEVRIARVERAYGFSAA